MKNRRWLWLLWLGMSLAASASPVFADITTSGSASDDQVRKSHSLDKLPLPTGDPDELFDLLLQSKRHREIAETLKKQKGLTAKDLERLKDPAFMDFLRNLKPSDLPRELREQLRLKGINDRQFEEILKQLKPADIQRALEGPKDHRAGHAASPGVNGQSTSDSPRGPRTSASEAPQGDHASSGAEPDSDKVDIPVPSSRLARWMLQLASRVQADPTLRDSPALRQAIRNLSRYAGTEDQRWQQLSSGADTLGDEWASWSQKLALDRLIPEEGWSWPGSLTPSAFPRIRWPDPKPGLLEGSSGSGESSGTTDTASDNIWRAILAVLGLGLLGLVLWRALARSRGASARGGKARWKLGPWPVQPAAVRTREDLIRAFEYLSVLFLGPAARNWNHRAIAVSLSVSSEKFIMTKEMPYLGERRRRAADQLATLYEQARYAPPNENLPEDAIARARRELCLLAGVAAP